METRELNKKRKKVYREIEDRELNQNIDFDKMDEKVSMKIRKDENNLPDLDQLEKVEELMKIRDKESESGYDYHRIRTSKNYELFMNMYFFNNNKSSVLQVTCGQQLHLKQLVTNNALTVVYVFWDFLGGKREVEKDKEIIKKIQDNLQKYSKMLRGKMCQKMQLKYAPDIRFIKSDSEARMTDVLKDMKKNIPQVILQDIQDDFEAKVKQDPDYNKIYTK